jgi:SAM-dependent methyltransferase
MTLRTKLKSIAKRFRYFGSQRYCAVCNHSSNEFLPAGVNPRPDARCPFCGSLERHRLTIIFFREKTNLFDGQPKDFLHVAPERALKRMFSTAIGSGYLTADLMADDVMEKMDITNIQHPEDSFDIIYCSHVLEHVPDDRKAMSEFVRVLRPFGWAVLNVPITADVTYEDPSITDPDERERLFGQHDHVRRYGPDYKNRLEEAGFRVSVFSPGDFLSSAEIERQGMSNGDTGEIYYCRQQKNAV